MPWSMIRASTAQPLGLVHDALEGRLPGGVGVLERLGRQEPRRDPAVGQDVGDAELARLAGDEVPGHAPEPVVDGPRRAGRPVDEHRGVRAGRS